MTSRYEYNWPGLTRQYLIDFLWKLYPKLDYATSAQFHKKFYNHLKSHFPLIVSKKFYSSLKPGRIHIGGVYYNLADYYKNRPCIEIKFYYPATAAAYKISRRQFYRLSKEFADTLLHEIIHMRQHRRRNYQALPNYASLATKKWQRAAQGYLGNKDEIDAYGFNIACELMDRFGDNEQTIVEHLNSPVKRKYRYDSWSNYLRAFNYDHNNKIIKRVKQRVIKHISHARRGKPYTVKEWIDK
jgi:hypothetical protein